MAQTTSQPLVDGQHDWRVGGFQRSHLDYSSPRLARGYGELWRSQPPGPKRQKGVVESECCSSAPPVLEFDEEGNLLNHWGADGDGYVWPDSNHGITVDFKGNVWIGGNGRGTLPGQEPGARGGRGGPLYYHDSMILKFTQEGKFLMQIGKSG